MANFEKIPTKGRFDDDGEQVDKKRKKKEKRKSRKDAHQEEQQKRDGFGSDELVIPGINDPESLETETQQPETGSDVFIEGLHDDAEEVLDAFGAEGDDIEDAVKFETYKAVDATGKEQEFKVGNDIWLIQDGSKKRHKIKEIKSDENSLRLEGWPGWLDFSVFFTNEQDVDIVIEKIKKNKETSTQKEKNQAETREEFLDGEEGNAEKLEKLKKELKEFEDDLEVTKNMLSGDKNIQKSAETRLLERVLYDQEKIDDLTFQIDLITSKDIEIIADIRGKKLRLIKEKKKSQKETTVDTKEGMEGYLMGDDISVNNQIKLEKDSKLSGQTSRIESIKKCEDGSYIIETNTSYYRLIIEKNEDKKAEEEIEKTRETEVKSTGEASEKNEEGVYTSIDQVENTIHNAAQNSESFQIEDLKKLYNWLSSEANEELDDWNEYHSKENLLWLLKEIIDGKIARGEFPDTEESPAEVEKKYKLKERPNYSSQEYYKKRTVLDNKDKKNPTKEVETNNTESSEDQTEVAEEALKRIELPELRESSEAAEKEIENLSEKEKKTFGEGLANLGYRIDELKNKAFRWAFEKVVGKKENPSSQWATSSRSGGSILEKSAEEIESTKKHGFLSRHLEALRDMHQKKEDASQSAREQVGKGGLKKLGGVGRGAGVVLRYGRILADFSFANPLRHAMAATSFAGFASETVKEGRLKKRTVARQTVAGYLGEKVDEEGKIESIWDERKIDKAKEEAWNLYEQAGLGKKEGEEITADDLDKVYKTNLPQDLSERFEQMDYSSSGIIERLTRLSLTRVNKKIEKIDSNQSLSEEERQKQRDDLLKRYDVLLHDLDRMVGDVGTVDTIVYLSRLSEKTSKLASAGLMVDTVGRGLAALIENADKISIPENFSLNKLIAKLGGIFEKGEAELDLDKIEGVEPKTEDLTSKNPDVLLDQAAYLNKEKDFSGAIERYLVAADKLVESDKADQAGAILDEKIEKIIEKNPELEGQFQARINTLESRLESPEIPDKKVDDPVSTPATPSSIDSAAPVEPKVGEESMKKSTSNAVDVEEKREIFPETDSAEDKQLETSTSPESEYPTTEIKREWVRGENEKLFHFGGHQRSGFNKEENKIIFDISKMTGIDMKDMRMFITLTNDNQSEVIEFPVDNQGKIIIDKESELAKKLFTEGEDGQLNFKGKQLEIAQVGEEIGDGPQKVKILATSVGSGELTAEDIKELSEVKAETSQVPEMSEKVEEPAVAPEVQSAAKPEVYGPPQIETPLENEVEKRLGHDLIFNEHLIKVGDQYSLVGVDYKGKQFDIFSFDPKLEEADIIRAVETHNTELKEAVKGKNVDPIQYMREAKLPFNPGNNAENIERLQTLVQNDIPVDKAQEVISLVESSGVPLEITAKHFKLVEHEVYTPEQRKSILQLIQYPDNIEAKNSLLEGYPKPEEVIVQLTGEDGGVKKLHLHYKEEDMDVFLYGDRVYASIDGKNINDVMYKNLKKGDLKGYLKDLNDSKIKTDVVDL